MVGRVHARSSSSQGDEGQIEINSDSEAKLVRYAATEDFCQRSFPIDLNLLTPSAPRSFRAFEPGAANAARISFLCAS
jgi:hypothetical protein